MANLRKLLVLLAVALMFALGVAAAPAPKFNWRSKQKQCDKNNKNCKYNYVCAQTSPGSGWQCESGPFAPNSNCNAPYTGPGHYTC